MAMVGAMVGMISAATAIPGRMGTVVTAHVAIRVRRAVRGGFLGGGLSKGTGTAENAAD